MLAVALVAVGLASGVTAALVLGGSLLRQFLLALAGLAGWALASTWFLGAECPPTTSECVPELGVLFAAFVLAGWLAGIGLVGLVRLTRRWADRRARGSGSRTRPT